MRFRDQLTIQQIRRTADAQTRQRVETTWTKYLTTRGQIDVAGSTERFIDDANRDTLLTHNIRIYDNRKTQAIKPAMRVVSDGRTFHIAANTYDPNSRRYRILKVTELANPR